ncbi:hypothetical protein [Streptomyces sp. HNM0575]|uniref:hypothetical protein n=1 Tax=Streptomyces sp. HNM0575 TaxID=2716338 RepID=UPI001F0D108C|nr:hypothetical protein [Streptomyces sp. HNM0575]
MPWSASTPQPPPPTGEPLTSETLRRGPYARGTDGQSGMSARGGTGTSGSAGGTGAPGPGTSGSGTSASGASGPGTSAPGGVPSPRTPAPPAPPGFPGEAGQPGGLADPGPPTWQLRPVRDRPVHNRPAPRTVAAAVCLVLGVGLLGGAAAGTWLTDDPGQQAVTDGSFDEMRAAWHNNTVDQLFPRVLEGKGAGPGGADRRWVRVAVAPDSNCRGAFDPLLAKALSPVGCSRLVRATYADETTSNVITVGLHFTRSEGAGMRALRKRFAVENLSERTDLMPRPYASRGTVSADFGDAQRASWTIRVLSDAPVVVYAVSGFADGRVVSDPQPAAEATERGETSAAAQAGLGHDAQGIADRIEQRLRSAAEAEDE